MLIIMYILAMRATSRILLSLVISKYIRILNLLNYLIARACSNESQQIVSGICDSNSVYFKVSSITTRSTHDLVL